MTNTIPQTGVFATGTRQFLRQFKPGAVAEGDDAPLPGAVGGEGLGTLAIKEGQQRYVHPVMLAALIALVILVQIFQTVGNFLARKCDKRLKS